MKNSPELDLIGRPYEQYDICARQDVLSTALQVYGRLQNDAEFAEWATEQGLKPGDPYEKFGAVAEEYDASRADLATPSLLDKYKAVPRKNVPPTPLVTQIADLIREQPIATAKIVKDQLDVVKTQLTDKADARLQSGGFYPSYGREAIEITPAMLKKGVVGAAFLGTVAMIGPGTMGHSNLNAHSRAPLAHALNLANVTNVPIANIIKKQSATTIVSPSEHHATGKNTPIATSERGKLGVEGSQYAQKIMSIAAHEAIKTSPNKADNGQNKAIVGHVDAFAQTAVKNLIADPTVELTPAMMTIAAEQVANVQIAVRFPEAVKAVELSDFQQQAAPKIIKALFSYGDTTYTANEQLTVAYAVAGAAEAMLPADNLAAYVQSLDMPNDQNQPNLPLPEATSSASPVPSVSAPDTQPSPAASEAAPTNVADLLTPDAMSKILPNATAENIAVYTPMILKALHERGIDSEVMVAYALATINAETSRFMPIPEYGSGQEYQGRLGNDQPGDGERYKGRGFIQLTGHDNYRTYGQKLGIDLVSNPDLALDPVIAARILAVFLEPRAERITHALKNGDFVQARAYVNGGRNGLEAMETSFKVAINILQPTLVIPEVPQGRRLTHAEHEASLSIPDRLSDGTRYFSQHNKLWGSDKYALPGHDQTISQSGCGPTTEAMIVTNLTGNEMTPEQMATWNMDNGFRTENNGTDLTSFTTFAPAFGLQANNVTGNIDQIQATLRAGGMVILNAQDRNPGTPGTRGGHILAMRGMTEDGKILILDPNSYEFTNQAWNLDELLSESTTQVAITK